MTIDFATLNWGTLLIAHVVCMAVVLTAIYFRRRWFKPIAVVAGAIALWLPLLAWQSRWSCHPILTILAATGLFVIAKHPFDIESVFRPMLGRLGQDIDGDLLIDADLFLHFLEFERDAQIKRHP